ncbi:hypothetical protein EI42_03613 [Thermosporothrix hazakensis]|uniref:Thiamine transporter n=2 Tax=Thermosporothrix TaxID=768650 RepID=A0A326UDP3_THEHA|nr:hypothetical protein [Thermosporothrix hazakensis]PZW27526.1 hypothetical protein EI42_03613 [Thermosporothrix hazakensis]BBH85880.1 hypothetical protein KTC_06310 [Thermosporothrix sp. COM3]GCE45693.1 hypothetical protein KTH_05620 [Thermosporothrix hazakensis]
MEESINKPRAERPTAPPDVEHEHTGGIRYSLRFTGWPTLNQLVGVAVATAVYTVLSMIAINAAPLSVPGVSSVFLAIGFGIPFAIWFGGWAFVIAYIGNFLGAGLLVGQALPTAAWFGTVDLVQLGLPMILYRLLAPRLGLSSIGKDVFTIKGFIFFLVCAVLLPNILGAFYGNFILVQTGVAAPNTFYVGVFGWILTNCIITAVLGSILLATLGPVVERFGLTVRNLLN